MASEDGSAAAVPPLAATLVGSVLGNYQIERELGRGGMGVVYAAVDQTLGKRVALKVLLPAISQRAELVQRFFNEARAASTIRHPGIVEVFHYGTDPDGTAYIVMEYLEGISLAARLKSHGLLSIPSAIAIARQTAAALAAAHRAGIVHRDLKPDNMFLLPDPEVSGGERVKLLDFGVAKLVDQPSSQPIQTVTGAILGTPQYMSPEQCEGARVVDHRTDLYSLGCTLFQMVTGRLPFLAGGMGGMIGAHLYEQPPHARDSNPLVSDRLDAIIDRLLAKSPDTRFQTGDEVVTALSDPATGVTTRPQPIPATPRPSQQDLGNAATLATRSPARDALDSAGRAVPTERGDEPSRSEAPARRVRWWIPVLGLLLVGGAAAAAFFAVRTRDEDPVSKAADPVPVPKINIKLTQPDPPKPVSTAPVTDDLIKAKLLVLRDAAKSKNFVKAFEFLSDIEASGDAAARAEADKVRAELHPAAIERALTEGPTSIRKLVAAGNCKAATSQATITARRWGADPLLDKATAGCVTKLSPELEDMGLKRDSRAAVSPGGGPIEDKLSPPVRDPQVQKILDEYGTQRYATAMSSCITSGPGVRIPVYECMVSACKSDRIQIAAALLLRGIAEGSKVDRGLNGCLPTYDVTKWLNTGDNRDRVLGKLRQRDPQQIQKAQQKRQGVLDRRGP